MKFLKKMLIFYDIISKKITEKNREVFTDIKEFLSPDRSFKINIGFKESLADLDTPLSCYKKILSKYRDKPSFLLESVESADRFGRYSIIGFNPFLTIKSIGKRVILEGLINDDFKADNPFETLRSILKRFQLSDIPFDLRFPGGAVGYIGYDMVRFFERLPDVKPKRLSLYDMFFIFPENLIVFDNFTHRMYILVLSPSDEKKEEKLSDILKILRSPLRQEKTSNFNIKGLKSNISKAQFQEMVIKAKEYICNGDIIQVVLSQRFNALAEVRDLDLYRALRVINPSPYMFFLNFNDYSLIGSSPEILVRLENNVVEVRPIAGTRKRGETEEEDKRLEEELLSDSKEIAEHIMLVDLGRNDVGRIAKIGSVSVPNLMTIERYSHVMHIVSSVKGQIKEGLDAFDVFKATFPAGTVTGAPKIRAMEIIEELEKEKREFYAGGVGYFGYNGNMDFCITIRTMLKKKKEIFIQAGAGIVADSIPENEYFETINKAKALFKSLTDLKEIID